MTNEERVVRARVAVFSSTDDSRACVSVFDVVLSVCLCVCVCVCVCVLNALSSRVRLNSSI